ncbi:uncharacterized protein UMAG_11870 [Mycosarcoma maydis]|uniref:Uncharacterized protein n=1 Tax=Mycosarcoma maydis TaxID=5270 RepID=A0A0D1CEG7_MYCMD|nr:uncharacterized protein UMAG_11870 [Ustilago maydis 521]KIS71452.1 hypothetical protein UMAG_11870 [Ustilago maydis 521]|eukprot:XP_011387476.1 hypothetical protein UMAG_11870 [Ustilago maydis 521]
MTLGPSSPLTHGTSLDTHLDIYARSHSYYHGRYTPRSSQLKVKLSGIEYTCADTYSLPSGNRSTTSTLEPRGASRFTTNTQVLIHSLSSYSRKMLALPLLSVLTVLGWALPGLHVRAARDILLMQATTCFREKCLC